MTKVLKTVFTLIMVVLAATSCTGGCVMSGNEKKVTISEKDELLPIDILASSFFTLLQPWKDGKLATIDGWGRFAELSFEKNGKIKVTPLMEFPKKQIDMDLVVWPEKNLFFVHSGKQMYLGDVATKKTKELIPYLTWVYDEQLPILLDSEESIMLFQYRSIDEPKFHNVVYDFKKDTQHEDLENSVVEFNCPFSNDIVFAGTYYKKEKRTEVYDNFLYNWRTKEVIRNKLTKALNVIENDGFYNFSDVIVSLKSRLIITTPHSTTYKITWNDDCSKVQTIKLNFLLPEGKRFQTFFFSPDGKWATVYITGYKGLYDEDLVRRVFFNIDEKYPGGISIPIFSEDYEVNHWMNGSFVNHPEYGMCYAHEYNKEDKEYLRLYKMSDVTTLIQKKLLEGAKKAGKK